MQDDPQTPPHLRRSLGVVHLWSIAVGMVISGQYFGWNYGFPVAGPLGMLAAAAIVTVFYAAFIFSYAELSTSIPSVLGPRILPVVGAWISSPSMRMLAQR